jgi:hypothetical protein
MYVFDLGVYLGYNPKDGKSDDIKVSELKISE